MSYQSMRAQTTWVNMIPSTGSLFSAYASASATITLLQQAFRQFIPAPLRDRIFNLFYNLLKRRPTSNFTLVVEEYHEIKRNPLFEAFEVYLRDKAITSSASCLKATTEDDNLDAATGCDLSLHLAGSERFTESFNGVEIQWAFKISDPHKGSAPLGRGPGSEDQKTKVGAHEEPAGFYLSFPKNCKDDVLNSYIPKVVKAAGKIMNKEKVLKLWTLKMEHGNYGKWESVKLDHPATFETLALDPDLKKSIIDDMNLFLERKEFYRKVGRAWKRGYLLYGPPGTGKSSLIAAMANYLKFDVYDIQPMNIHGDNMLRKILFSTTKRSILVIEDIDCSMGLAKKRNDSEDDEDDEDDSDSEEERKKLLKRTRLGHHGCSTSISLSGLLNFLDGLWSNCGDERIIIFTTNHKERIDPALLRPGRMDMHIHMSYLGMPAFKLLASKYLDISLDGTPHYLFEEIGSLMETTQVTPAEVAGELMKSKHVDAALQEVIQFLKRKKTEMDLAEMAKKAKEIRKQEKAKKKAAIKALVGQNMSNHIATT